MHESSNSPLGFRDIVRKFSTFLAIESGFSQNLAEKWAFEVFRKKIFYFFQHFSPFLVIPKTT